MGLRCGVGGKEEKACLRRIENGHRTQQCVAVGRSGDGDSGGGRQRRRRERRRKKRKGEGEMIAGEGNQRGEGRSQLGDVGQPGASDYA
ncbi:hypothetical protein Droror1_Dr00000275 [Drosera rotundifolia]